MPTLGGKHADDLAEGDTLESDLLRPPHVLLLLRELSIFLELGLST